MAQTIAEQVQELKSIKDGWDDGDPDFLAPTPTSIARAEDAAKLVLSMSGVTPYLFPTQLGGVQLVWEIGMVSFDVSFLPSNVADIRITIRDASGGRQFVCFEVPLLEPKPSGKRPGLVLSGPSISAQMAELAQMEPGWHPYNPKSKVPTKATMDRVELQLWAWIEAIGCPRPVIFPSMNGGIEAVWPVHGRRVTVRFDRRGKWASASWVAKREGGFDSDRYVGTDDEGLALWLRGCLVGEPVKPSGEEA